MVPPAETELGRSVRLFSSRDLHASYCLPLPPGEYRVTVHLVRLRDDDPKGVEVHLEGESRSAETRALEHPIGITERRVFRGVEVDDGLLEIDFLRQGADAAVLALEIERE